MNRALTYEEWLGNRPGNDDAPTGVTANGWTGTFAPVGTLDLTASPDDWRLSAASVAMNEVVILATALRRAANMLDEAMDEVRKRKRAPVSETRDGGPTGVPSVTTWIQPSWLAYRVAYRDTGSTNDA